MSLAFLSMELLWRNALGAIPLAMAVALICRCVRCRPSTRHALWLIVLLSLLAPPSLSLFDPPALLATIRAPLAMDAKRPSNLETEREPSSPVAVEPLNATAWLGEKMPSPPAPLAGPMESTGPETSSASSSLTLLELTQP